ncbi:MAG: hypothetical protein AAGN66_10170, partial [Acidobacteriota bacterium]
DHHAVEHGEMQDGRSPNHDHDAAEHVPTMIETAFHGHRHDQDGAAEHSHDVTFGTTNASQRESLSVGAFLPTATSSRVASADSPALPRSRADFGQVSVDASPPLFTAHCSLLI